MKHTYEGHYITAKHLVVCFRIDYGTVPRFANLLIPIEHMLDRETMRGLMAAHTLSMAMDPPWHVDDQLELDI